MARGAHPHPRRVFFGRLESNLPPPSCSHQRFGLREFPISPDWDNPLQRTNRGGPTSQSPLPHPNLLDRISSQSHSGGDSFSGPRLSRVWFIQRVVWGPLILAWGSLFLMCVLCGKPLTLRCWSEAVGSFVQKWLKMEDGRVDAKWKNHRSKTQEMKQKERASVW